MKSQHSIFFSGAKFTGFGSKSDADVTKSHERVIFFKKKKMKSVTFISRGAVAESSKAAKYEMPLN